MARDRLSLAEQRPEAGTLAPTVNLYLGQGGFYVAPSANSPDDYRIVEDDQAAEDAIRDGDLPLVIPPRVLAGSPTLEELDRYLRAQYETPDAPFGELARQRSGARVEPPQVDPRYDMSDAPVREDPLDSDELRQNVSDEWSGRGTITRGAAPTLRRDVGLDALRARPADLIPRAEPPLPPPSSAPPSLAGSLPSPVPSPRSQVPQLATPTTPELIPLADYLQQRLLEVSERGPLEVGGQGR